MNLTYRSQHSVRVFVDYVLDAILWCREVGLASTVLRWYRYYRIIGFSVCTVRRGVTPVGTTRPRRVTHFATHRPLTPLRLVSTPPPTTDRRPPPHQHRNVDALSSLRSLRSNPLRPATYAPSGRPKFRLRCARGLSPYRMLLCRRDIARTHCSLYSFHGLPANLLHPKGQRRRRRKEHLNQSPRPKRLVRSKGSVGALLLECAHAPSWVVSNFLVATL